MKSGYLIILAVLLLMLQPAVCQPTANKNCISGEPVNMGDIGKDKFNFNEKGNLSPGVAKWFSFDVKEPVRFFVVVSEDDADSYSNTNFGMVVYDEKMDIVTTSDGGNILLDLAPAAYYLRLDARPYLMVNYTLIASNNFETEPNDGISEANDIGNISQPIIFGGSFTPAGDTDFIKISLSKSQEGMLSIKSADVNMVLYGYNESLKYFAPQVTGGSYLSAFLDPGTYYVRVDSSYSTINYTLNISLAEANCEDEPNDDFAQALDLGTLVSAAALTKDACIKTADDKDYFAFTVPEEMGVTVKTITDGDTVLYLYDADEKELDYNDDYDGRASRIDKELKAGKYYAMVKAYSSGGLSYKISINQTE